MIAFMPTRRHRSLPLFEPRPGLPAGGRDECRHGERPCPYVRCKWHLWRVDPLPVAGRLKVGATQRASTPTRLEPRWLEYPTPGCCALDAREAFEREHPGALMPLAAVGAAMARDGDTAGKILRRAIAKVRAVMQVEPIADPHEHEKCHAGAGHAAATERGTYGWLCDTCWERVLRQLERERGIKRTPSEPERDS